MYSTLAPNILMVRTEAVIRHGLFLMETLICSHLTGSGIEAGLHRVSSG
jgi:hypothetical protein